MTTKLELRYQILKELYTKENGAVDLTTFDCLPIEKGIGSLIHMILELRINRMVDPSMGQMEMINWAVGVGDDLHYEVERLIRERQES